MRVQNWFQNRRAKSKQDAKKAYNMFQSQNGNANFSDSDTSPAFTSHDYFTMMQQCAADEQQLATGFGLGQMPTFQAGNTMGGQSFNQGLGVEHFNGNALQVPFTTQGMFDSTQDLNRRTLTQEQFNALAQNGGMMATTNQFDSLSPDFSNSDILGQVFPDMSRADLKQDDSFSFPSCYSEALSSNDSSVPSSISEHSMFPPGALTDSTNLSASPDDWADSRSSSIPAPNVTEAQPQFPQMPPATHETLAAASQWQPGQSKPVQLSVLQQQFREAQALQQASQQAQSQQAEQPLAWPDDEAFLRRDSQNSTALSQQMSEFALQTPQPPQQAQFKPPQPAAGSIAARRHVKRPAALGIASLRSTSYSGAAGPASPGQGLKPTQQPLRRIQSSVALNGVAQGRVVKGSIGSAQRSPLNFTFAESLNSPKALRHASTSSAGPSSLAPPTPLSPTEMTIGDPSRQQAVPQWPSQAIGRHASISETDAEHTFSSGNVVPQKFSSPPHTPMFNQGYQQFLQTMRPGMMLENTPPQSAPACQQTFPSNIFMMAPPAAAMPPPPPPQMAAQQQPVQNFSAAQQFPMGMVPLQPEQQFVMPLAVQQSGLTMPMQFSTEGTTLDPSANMMAMAMPMSQMQFMPAPPAVSGPASMPQQQTQMCSPPQQAQYNFVSTTSSDSSPDLHASATLPKAAVATAPATELFVHEYSPPQDVKQSSSVAATPRKQADLGPKNYTFANHGPEHYEKDKSKKGSVSVSSSSPESSTDN